MVADLHVAAASVDSKTGCAKALSPKTLGLQALKPKAPNIKALKKGTLDRVPFFCFYMTTRLLTAALHNKVYPTELSPPWQVSPKPDGYILAVSLH